MKFLLLLVGLVASAHAERVVMEGKLSTGGSLYVSSVSASVVMQGTATVQGNAFSVGGSTFIISNGSVSIQGTTYGDNAPSGYVGEYISSGTLGGVSYAGNNTAFNVVQITLTPGDWDIQAVAETLAGGTTWTAILAMITTASASIGAANDNPPNYVQEVPTSMVTYNHNSIPPPVRASITTNTTYYLVVFGTYSGTTPKANGIISARRRR